MCVFIYVHRSAGAVKSLTGRVRVLPTGAGGGGSIIQRYVCVCAMHKIKGWMPRTLIRRSTLPRSRSSSPCRAMCVRVWVDQSQSQTTTQSNESTTPPATDTQTPHVTHTDLIVAHQMDFPLPQIPPLLRPQQRPPVARALAPIHIHDDGIHSASIPRFGSADPGRLGLLFERTLCLCVVCVVG